MIKVRNILETKKLPLFTTTGDTMVYDALKMMKENNIGAVVVMEKEKFIGIFTERDYARKVVLLARASRFTPVKDIIVQAYYMISPEDSIEHCMNLMVGKSVHYLPVFENKRFVGIISIGDVVKCVIDYQKDIIEQLDNYISGAKS